VTSNICLTLTAGIAAGGTTAGGMRRGTATGDPGATTAAAAGVTGTGTGRATGGR